jgi:excisionase family DNA binding protein
MLNDYPDVLEFKEVCELLKISRPTLHEILVTGKLEGFKVGKKDWRIPKESIQKFIRENCTGNPS